MKEESQSNLGREAQHLHGLVDMGSNGIRFSITDLAPAHARILPTIYQHRASISLYDAQYPKTSPGHVDSTSSQEQSESTAQRQPIDETTIADVVAALQRFQRVCGDFGVPASNIKVLATEATRTAPNSVAFCERIRAATEWKVEMLSKSDEGKVGALGVLSSLPEVKGLMMDLGGGSTQLSFIDGSEDVMSNLKAVSLPYGAAAMTRRLEEAERNGKTEDLREEVMTGLREAVETLNLSQTALDNAKRDGGFTLYLSGGGFRGWGYLLMRQHQVQPYPIPVINGFKALRADFLDTKSMTTAAAAALEDAQQEIFRVSDRRASQVPAVAFLVNALAQALPEIKEVRFCQGGVREGYLLSILPQEIKSLHPLLVATQPFQSPSSQAIADLIGGSLPSNSTAPAIFTPALLRAFANLMYYHSSYSKDFQGSAALRSTTSGLLAGVHGLLHESRAALALLLCARWGVDVPPTDESFKSRLEQVLGAPWILWWIQYFGAIAALVASVYPAGVIDEGRRRLTLGASWGQGEKQQSILNLQIGLSDATGRHVWEKELGRIEKVGKKKNWIGGRNGVGCKIAVEVLELDDAH